MLSLQWARTPEANTVKGRTGLMGEIREELKGWVEGKSKMVLGELSRKRKYYTARLPTLMGKKVGCRVLGTRRSIDGM